jgi:MFS family permease
MRPVTTDADAETAPAGASLSSPIAAALTFLAAASVLVLEIAAGRLLAPYVGVSLTTVTGIIGVILAGIAIGAWAGGRLADRFGPERLLGPTFVLGGLAAMVAVPTVSIVGSAGLASGVAEIVLISTVAFVLPAAILSAVAPMIVRASLTDLRTSGALVGRLSAVGTVGAISGTFLTGFVLLGLLPTRVIVIGTGGLLVLVGLALAWSIGRARAGVLVGLVASVVVAASAMAAPYPCQTESAYYCMAVIDDPAFPGGDRRILVLDDLWHAAVDLDDPSVLLFGYVRRFADATASVVDRRGPALESLHIGGGGFSFPRYLAAVEPGSRHTVLELDPAVVALDRRELGFEPSDAIRVRLGDARLSIVDEPTDGYDLVVGDAFGGLSVPWHLTTLEFVDEIDRVLRPDGIYVMNIIDGPALGFVRAELATLRDRFDHVALVGQPAALAGRAGGNLVLVASQAPIDADAVRGRIAAAGELDGADILAAGPGLDAFIGDASVLTDDHAPVDQLIGR